MMNKVINKSGVLHFAMSMAMLVLLQACNSESTTTDNNETPATEPTYGPTATYGGADNGVNSGYQVVALPLVGSNNNGIMTFADNDNAVANKQPQIVNLADVVTLNDAEIISLNSLNSMGTGASYCDSSADIKGLEFTVSINSPANCQYEYTVLGTDAAGDEVQQTAVMSVIASANAQGIDIAPILIELPFNSTGPVKYTIDLDGVDGVDGVTVEPAANSIAATVPYLEDYVLTDVTILGEGEAAIDTDDPRTNSIDYTVYTNQVGYTRLIYTLENAGSIKTGAIDITVSEGESAPTAADFCFPALLDQNNLSCEPEIGEPADPGVVRLGETTAIDIQDYITAGIGNDGDIVQLVHVESMTANVVIGSDEAGSVSNTKFMFTAQNQGKHYVTYLAADHYGHFKSAFITINVGAPMFTQIESYADASLALSAKGNVWFAGRAQRNNAGLPTCDDGTGDCKAYVYNRWVKVPTLRNIVQITTTLSANSFALDRDNNLWVIGDNAKGELGIGLNEVVTWTEFDVAATHNGNDTFATHINNQLTETGYTFTSIKRIVGGWKSSYVLVNVEKSGDTRTLLFSTGDNSSGQLGTGSESSNVTQWTLAQFEDPWPVNKYNVFDVSGSQTHALIVAKINEDVSNDFKIYATGNNTYGQFGDEARGADQENKFVHINEISLNNEPQVYAAGLAYGASYIKGAQGAVYVAGANNFCQLLLGPKGQEKDSEGVLVPQNLAEGLATRGVGVDAKYSLNKFTRAAKPLSSVDNDYLGTVQKMNVRGYFVYLYKEILEANQTIELGTYVAGNNANHQLGVGDDSDLGQSDSADSNCYLKRVPNSTSSDILAPGISHGLIASSIDHTLMATGLADYRNSNDDNVIFRDWDGFTLLKPNAGAIAVCSNSSVLRSDAGCIQVLKSASGEFYTAPISHGALLTLDYKTNNTPYNQGKTFANYVLTNESVAVYGYKDGYYDFEAFLRQDGIENQRSASIENNGEGGQFDRLCQHLSAKHFYGKNDWRRASYEDLQGISDISTPETDSPFVKGTTLWTDDLGVLTLGAASDSNSNTFGDLSEQHQAICVTGPKPATPAFVNVAIGREFSYGLLANGKLMSVGYNTSGQLAIGDNTAPNNQKNNWVNANQTEDGEPELSAVVDIAVGANFAYALTSDGTLWSVGGNKYGQLGLGQTGSATVWNKLTTDYPTNIKQIIAANYNAYLLTAEGKVWGVGDNRDGQLGASDIIETCTVTTGGKTKDISCSKTWKKSTRWDANGDGNLNSTLPNITSISAGIRFAYALDSDGSIWSIGSGESGQLGIGGEVAADSKIDYWQISYDASANEPIVKVAAGGNSGYAIGASGNVYVVGLNDYGQLGIPSVEEPLGTSKYDHSDKINIWQTIDMNDLPPRFKTIVPGWHHAYALDYSGNVYSVGLNDHGQLGLGNADDSPHPQWQASFLTGVEGVALHNITDVIAAPHLRSNFGFARKADTGWLWSVGDNDMGQQGRNSATSDGNSINQWMQYRVSTANN